MDADGRQPHPPGRRVGRGPLHKRCVSRMISYLLGEGTVSAPGDVRRLPRLGPSCPGEVA